MIQLPDVLSPRDVHQWIAGGWGLLDGDLIVTVGDDEDDGQHLRDLFGDHVEFDFRRELRRLAVHWPKCGSLNLSASKFAIHLERRSRQQYRRTYNARCLTLTVPDKWHLLKAGVLRNTHNPDHPEVVEAAFNPEYPSFEEATRMLNEAGWGSVALSPYLIVSQGLKGQNVFYRGERAGMVVDGRFHSAGKVVSPARMYKLFQGEVEVRHAD